MNENVSPSQTDPNIQTAVLLLPSEPDWYWQNLAEVPFLLRNALTLQRAGIKNLLIWMQSPTEKMDAIHQKLKQDRRMGLDVEWITDNTSGLQDTNFMVLDGSTLLEKSEVVEAMAPSSQYQADTSGFHFFPDTLKQPSQKKYYKNHSAT